MSERIPPLPRRRFLGQLAAGAAVGVLAPAELLATDRRSRSGFEHPRARVPASAPDRPGATGASGDVDWEAVKARFPLHPARVSMNAANLCPTPGEVTAVMSRYAAEIDGDQSFQNRDRFGGLRDDARAAMAAYLGADPDEVALVRNTSEGNNIVIAGLDLGPGDEVLAWDQNHASNQVAWDVRAERSGFSVRRVTTPEDPQGEADLLDPFLDALTPETRVVSLTHLSNVTGVRLPVRALTRACRERGILTLVDGAQTFGADALDLHDLGCDFFTGSAHKWFVGPKEMGILYVRRTVADRVWPGIVSVGWPAARERGALRFETLGQQDDARVASLRTALDFHREIGPERIEARVHDLARTLREGIREAVPGVHFVTPEDPARSGGVLVFRLPGVEARSGYEALYRDHGVGGAAMGDAIRLCPHIYNTMADVAHAVEAARAVATGS